MSEIKEIDPLFKVAEAAKALKKGESTIWAWIRSGKLSAVRVGGSVRIPKSAILAIIDPYHVRNPEKLPE